MTDIPFRRSAEDNEVDEEKAPVTQTSKSSAQHVEVTTESAFIGLTRLQAFRRLWRPVLICYTIAFACMMDGFQASLPGGIVANPGFIQQFGTVRNAAGALALNPSHISAWAGLQFCGQFGGAFTMSFVSDLFGRKIGMACMSTFFVLGVITETVSRDWTHWLAAKFLTGLGLGACQSVMVTYLSEMAPTQIRGALTSSYAFGYAAGQLLAAVSLQIVAVTDPTNYLKAIYSQWVPLGLWIILWFFLPESPWYHVRKGHHEKARHVLSRIFKGVDGFDVDRECNVMIHEIEQEKTFRSTDGAQSAWMDLFRGVNLKRTFAAVFAFACQKWSGASVVFNYTTYFFQQAGIPKPFQANVIVYCILMGSLCVSFYVIERLGRRTLILGGLVAACVLDVIIGTMGTIQQTTASQNATLAVICLWVLNYAFCFAGVTYTLMGEVSTPRLRAKTASFAPITNAIAGALYDTTVPMMLAKSGFGAQGWGLKTLYMFAILSAIGFGINFLMIPETKNRSFAEMDEMYELRVAPRRMKAYVTEIERSGRKQH